MNVKKTKSSKKIVLKITMSMTGTGKDKPSKDYAVLNNVGQLLQYYLHLWGQGPVQCLVEVPMSMERRLLWGQS